MNASLDQNFEFPIEWKDWKRKIHHSILRIILLYNIVHKYKLVFAIFSNDIIITKTNKLNNLAIATNFGATTLIPLANHYICMCINICRIMIIALDNISSVG